MEGVAVAAAKGLCAEGKGEGEVGSWNRRPVCRTAACQACLVLTLLAALHNNTITVLIQSDKRRNNKRKKKNKKQRHDMLLPAHKLITCARSTGH